MICMFVYIYLFHCLHWTKRNVNESWMNIRHVDPQPKSLNFPSGPITDKRSALPLIWYRKIAIELLFGNAMVNAHIFYKEITKKWIEITDFQINVSKELLKNNLRLVAIKRFENQEKLIAWRKKEVKVTWLVDTV